MKRTLTRSYTALNTSAVGAHLHDPTPTDILRATLITQPKSIVAIDSSTSPKEHIHRLLDEEWRLGSPPEPLWHALKQLYPSWVDKKQLLPSVTDLSALRQAAERILIDKTGAREFQESYCEPLRQALQRCERNSTDAEILSTLSDIIARCHRLELRLFPGIYELALYYAALGLLTSALPQLMQGYSKFNSLRPVQRNSAVLCALYQAIDSALFEDPHYDTRPLRAVLFGEGETTTRHQFKLSDALGCLNERRDDWTICLCILARLRSKQTLRSLWNEYLKGFNSEDIGSCHSAYQVIVSLIQARRSDTALKFLEEIAQQAGGNLPHLETFGNVQSLVDDAVVSEALYDLVQEGENYKLLLESRLEDVERRLAIHRADSKGTGQHHVHSSITHDSTWDTFQDEPLLTIGGDSAGYDHPVRLYAELRASGCSRSADTLGQLVNLLNEQDGNTLGIFAFDEDQASQPHPELRWSPEHSPIEFSGSPLPTLYEHFPKLTPASLGLIRARSMIKGIPQGGTRCLHLLQLGSMEMRSSPDDPWQPSGYIVTWDRQHGELIAVWVGKNWGVVDPGPTPPDAPFGTIMHIRTELGPDDLPVFANSVPRDGMGTYYLDVDPGVDLGFQ